MYEDEQLGFLIKSLSDRMMSRGNRDLASLLLTFSQLRVLEKLVGADARGTSLSPSDLERALGVSQPTVAGLVKRLEAKGLVRTGVDQSDRRFRVVELTDAGRDTFARAELARKAGDAELAGMLSPDEMEQLRTLLVRLIERIDAGAGEAEADPGPTFG